MTTIEDVLTYIDGSNANGRLVVAWKPFTVGNVNAAGGELEWPIVDGEVSISLYANTGAQPTGSYYVAKYELENGAVYLEQWVVPNLPTVNLGQVRVSFPPSPSVMISPLQLTSLNAQPGMFLQWDGQRWVPAYPSTFNLDPNWIAITTDASGNDVGVIGSPVHLGNSVTIHIPDAGLTSRGVVTTSPQSFGGVKTFANTVNISTSIKFALRSVAPVYGELLGFGTGGADTSLSFGGNIIASRVSPVDRPYVRADSFIGSSMDLATFGIVPTAVMPGSLANPARTLAAFLLPVAGTVDWTGIGTDTTGALWLRTGTSVSAGFLYLDTAGNVTAREFRMDPYQHLNAPGVEAVRSDATMVMYSGTTDWAGYGVNSTPEMWFRMGPNAAGAYYYFGAGGARFPGNLTVGNIVVSGGVTLPPGTYVPTSRRVNTSTGLTGGGPLTADLTLSAVDNTTTQKVEAAQAGLVKAVRKRLNFIAGAGQLITVVDDSGNDQANVTITSSTSGTATPSIYSVNGTPVGTQPELNLVAGTNVILNGVNNGGLNRVDITVTTSGGAAITDPTTAIGDLVVRGTATPSPLTRLGVGTTTGYVLTTDLTTAPYIKWADRVPITRQIIAGAGLGGGGALGGIAATDVTLTANVVSVNGQTGAVVLTAANVGGVPTTRQVIAGTGLTGGGPLSSDVTLAVVNDTVTERVRISNAGTLVGTRQQINFIQGSNITLTVADVPGSNWVGVTVAATTSGMTDPTTTKGDLIVRPVGPPATRLGVGATDGMVLTVDSTDTTFGIKWKVVPVTPPTPLTPWTSDIDGAGFTLKNVGKIGVGVATPTDELVVASTSTVSATRGITSSQFSNSAQGGIISTAKYRGTVLSPQPIQVGDYVGSINFYGYTGSALLGLAEVRVQTDGATDSGAVEFFTTNLGTGTEKMRITAAGRVGIGTTNPLMALDVNGAIHITGGSPAINSPSSIKLDYSGGNARYISMGPDTVTRGGFQFIGTYSDNTGVTVPMVITPAGSVGVATSNPQFALDVAGAFHCESAVFKPASGSLTISFLDGVPSTTTTLVQSNSLVKFSNNAIPIEFDANTNGGVTGQLYLATSGSIGIGTTGPFSRISFGGTFADARSRIAFYEGPTGGGCRGAGIATPSSGVYGVAIWALSSAVPTDSNMQLFVRDDVTGGAVGIGVNIPSYRLDVAGDVNCSGVFRVAGAAVNYPLNVQGSGGLIGLGVLADIPGLTITIPYGGRYLVFATVLWQNSGDINNLGRLYLNANGVQQNAVLDFGSGAGSGSQGTVTGAWHVVVPGGSVIKIQGAKLSGPTVQVLPSASNLSTMFVYPT